MISLLAPLFWIPILCSAEPPAVSELYPICRRFESEVHLSEDACEQAMRELSWLADDIEEEGGSNQRAALKEVEAVKRVIALLDGCEWELATPEEVAIASQYMNVSVVRLNHGSHCVEVHRADVGNDGYQVLLVYNPGSNWISFSGEYGAQLSNGHSKGSSSCGIGGDSYRQLVNSRDHDSFDRLKLLSATCTQWGF